MFQATAGTIPAGSQRASPRVLAACETTE